VDDVSRQLLRQYPEIERLRRMRWWPSTALFLAHRQRLGPPSWPVDDEARRRPAARFAELPDTPKATAERVPTLFRYWVALWQLFTEERGPAIAEETHP